jgi:hypothetical protein
MIKPHSIGPSVYLSTTSPTTDKFLSIIFSNISKKSADIPTHITVMKTNISFNARDVVIVFPAIPFHAEMCLGHHHARGLSHAIRYNMWRPKLSVQKVERARTAQHRKHRNILEQAAQVYRISI